MTTKVVVVAVGEWACPAECGYSFAVMTDSTAFSSFFARHECTGIVYDIELLPYPTDG